MTIYERSSLNNEIGAAINVPPNVGRFLLAWGLDPVKSRFVKTPCEEETANIGRDVDGCADYVVE